VKGFMMKNFKLCFIFFMLPLTACQYHGKIGPSGVQLPAIYNAHKLASIEDVLEYQSLLHSCKMIKQNMRVIGDHRMSVEDAIEASITMYLEGIKGDVAKILLEDIRKNGFQL
jgi:hypothetical protein